MARAKAPPPIVVKRRDGSFAPLGAWDAERTADDATGCQYDLVYRSRRSLKQQRLYWQMLAGIVSATGLWPSSEHLHDEIKFSLGYVRKGVNLKTGEAIILPDSTAFNAMDDQIFRAYFDQAVELIARETGIDPLAFYEQGKAA